MATAQPAAKVWKIGIIEPFNAAVRANLVAAFREGLREHGYEEGRNIVLEPRFAEGKLERLPELAADLVAIKVDVIVASSSQAIQASQNATRTIPIVMTTVGDPVGPGFVASLGRPGGNITGLTIQAPELIAKRLQLLKEAVPKVTRVAVIWDPAIIHEVNGYKEAEMAAHALGVKLLSMQVARAEDLESAFATVTRDGADGLLVFENALTSNNGKRIVELALKHRLAGVYGLRELAQAGGLIAYGPSRSRQLPSRRRLRRQDFQRREAGGSSGGAAHQVRAGDQLEDGQGPRAHDPADPSSSRRSGHRMTTSR